MKVLVRASCGHDAVFDEPDYERWTPEHRKDYIDMLKRDATCNACGAKAEAASRELEALAKLYGDKSFDY